MFALRTSQCFTAAPCLCSVWAGFESAISESFALMFLKDAESCFFCRVFRVEEPNGGTFSSIGWALLVFAFGYVLSCPNIFARPQKMYLPFIYRVVFKHNRDEYTVSRIELFVIRFAFMTMMSNFISSPSMVMHGFWQRPSASGITFQCIHSKLHR